MRCHSLKGFHPKWWCLSYWRSFQIGGTLIVIWCYLTRWILLRSDHSLSTELYSSVAIDLSSIEVKIVVSNIFKLCSPVRFDSQVQNQVAYISSCWSIWGNVYLRNSCLAHSVSSQRWDKNCFSNSWSGFSWLQDVVGVLQRGQWKIWRH